MACCSSGARPACAPSQFVSRSSQCWCAHCSQHEQGTLSREHCTEQISRASIRHSQKGIRDEGRMWSQMGRPGPASGSCSASAWLLAADCHGRLGSSSARAEAANLGNLRFISATWKYICRHAHSQVLGFSNMQHAEQQWPIWSCLVAHGLC